MEILTHWIRVDEFLVKSLLQITFSRSLGLQSWKANVNSNCVMGNTHWVHEEWWKEIHRDIAKEDTNLYYKLREQIALMQIDDF